MGTSDLWYWRSLAAELNTAEIWAVGQEVSWTAHTLRWWARSHYPKTPRPEPALAHQVQARQAVASRPLEDWEQARPIIRADCVDGPRPCPWVACVHHLGIHVDSKGRIRAQPGVRDGDLEGLPFGGCALDASDAGPHGLEEIARFLGTWKGEVQRIIADAQAQAQARGRWSAVG
ncbi:MAG: hypothetical protein RBU30_08950 [Polyangia bacterium]|nr:hypothetical protein [Polyangia bacterium]